MNDYTDVNGVPFTDDDMERWAEEAESAEGFTGGHKGPSVPGRPISVGVAARPFPLRLDAARRAKLNDAAQARHTTASQLVRDLIDAL